MRLLRFFFAGAVALSAALFDQNIGHLTSEGDVPHLLAGMSVPTILSVPDQNLYKNAFRLERNKHSSDADVELKKVSNPLLIGILLAERYTTPHYKPRYEELSDWLAQYKDCPQAADIYRVALAHKPANASFPSEPNPSASTAVGFLGAAEKSVLHESGTEWREGLASYRRGDMATAAMYFQALSDEHNDWPANDRAAVAFWAYRALSSLGKETDARRYALRAAEQPPGFYSLLARKVTGINPHLSPDVKLQKAQIEPLLSWKAVQRAIALKEIAEDSLAGEELRNLFDSSSVSERRQLITLASLLNLPAAGMYMALETARANDETSDTVYPMPHWEPVTGYHIQPALLFAIMRQESGFNPTAHSAAGATGVMQLMPATAHAMAVELGLKYHSPAPAISMTLGQGYLERLMDMSAIGDNLILLLASYNAGPGTVENWKRKLHYNNDPLLFIESVPYNETRQYVLRVLGSYWVYSQLLGVEEVPSIAALADGNWPRYQGSSHQLTAMINYLGRN